MKKQRLLLVIGTLVLLLLLTACGESDPQESTSPSESGSSQVSETLTPPSSQIPSENAMDVYKSVLQSKSEFFSVEANQNLDMTRLSQALTSDISLAATVLRFAVIDLDSDGTPEVVLWMKLGENDSVGSIVLNYQDGIVYGHTLFTRQFGDLKTDGTFQSSGGAGSYGICTIAFDKNGYTIDQFTYREDSSYYVDHRSATEQEFNAAFNSHSEKQNVEWHDFTDANIEHKLSGNAISVSGANTGSNSGANTGTNKCTRAMVLITI